MRIAGYEVIEEIGRGGMGTVYLASYPGVDRPIALKVAHRNSARGDSRERWFRSLFYNEMRATAMLHHPNIVEIHDAGVENDELYYIAMEHVAGARTLDAFCHGDPLLSVREAAEVIMRCAEALEHAHRKGVIHRDVKPANILISETGDVKLSDFGIALLASSSEVHTQPMEPIGSPLYMSPEQLRGEAVTQQSDLFALGVVLYELLTGEHPFVAQSITTLTHRIVNEAPVPLSRLRPEVPPSLAAIVERAMAKTLEERYGGALELAFDIAGAFEELGLPAAETLSRDRVVSLRALGFFRDFREADLWELLRWSGWREYRAGEAILAEGEEEDAFHIIIEGEVGTFQQDRTVATLGRGECFGVTSYLGRAVAGESAIAKQPTAVLEVTAEALERAAVSCRAQFQKALIGILIQRLRASVRPLGVLESDC